MLSIFFAKTRMGWKESVVSEHANADGKPFIFEVILIPGSDLVALTS